MQQTITQKSHTDLEYLSKFLDDKFELGGFKFGISLLIDLVPVVGDIATTAIAIYVFLTALQNQVPKGTVTKMAGNMLVYLILGLIPVIGDFFQAWWKPSQKNVRILQGYFDRQ